jgi:beta-xylosidase
LGIIYNQFFNYQNSVLIDTKIPLLESEKHHKYLEQQTEARKVLSLLQKFLNHVLLDLSLRRKSALGFYVNQRNPKLLKQTYCVRRKLAKLRLKLVLKRRLNFSLIKRTC